MVGVGRGAQAGVLIKNAEALERMEKVDTLVIDKTGTLTEGKPRVIGIVPAHGFDENEVLRFAAGVESRSEHPLAHAIVAAAASAASNFPTCAASTRPTGKGVRRHGRAPARRHRQREIPRRAWRRRGGRLKPMADGLRAGRRDRDLHRDRRQGVAGVIAIADPVQATHARGA